MERPQKVGPKLAKQENSKCGKKVKTFTNPVPCNGPNRMAVQHKGQGCGQQVVGTATLSNPVLQSMPVLTSTWMPPMPVNQWVINLSNQYQVIPSLKSVEFETHRS